MLPLLLPLGSRAVTTVCACVCAFVAGQPAGWLAGSACGSACRLPWFAGGYTVRVLAVYRRRIRARYITQTSKNIDSWITGASGISCACLCVIVRVRYSLQSDLIAGGYANEINDLSPNLDTIVTTSR